MGTNGQGVIKVTFYQRKSRKYNNFSIENYFNAVRRALPDYIIAKLAISKFESNGLLRRIYNSIEAIAKQSDVNHITGDVHYLAYFLHRKKTMLSIMDCGQLNVLKGIKFRLFRYFWFRLPASRCSYLTTISTATKNDLLQHINFDEKKIMVIPVCVAPDFKKHDKPFNKIKPRILQVGVTPNKNLERLVQSLSGIPCSLVIIGNVPQHIISLAAEEKVDLEKFDRPLSMQEVVVEYENADVITLVSTLEGFGMPIVEGNIVGRVVITGNVTSMPEVAGEAAHLVDPFSVDDIREGFQRVIHDDGYREQLIGKGFENCKRFSDVKIAEQFTGIYKRIAEENK